MRTLTQLTYGQFELDRFLAELPVDHVCLEDASEQEELIQATDQILQPQDTNTSRKWCVPYSAPARRTPLVLAPNVVAHPPAECITY